MIKRNYLKKFLYALVVAFTLICLSACGTKDITKETWDQFVDAFNAKDLQKVGEFYFESDTEVSKWKEELNEEYFGGVTVKTKSYETKVNCDFSTELKAEAYYSGVATCELTNANGTSEVTFEVYYLKTSDKIRFCNEVNLVDEAKGYGNTPTSGWVSKAYYENKDYLYQRVIDEVEGYTITVSQQETNSKKVVLPSHIDGYKVTKIDKYAFYKPNKLLTFTTKGSSLQSIQLPNTLETIGKFAFYQCGNLKTIEIPESVKVIESNAFASCTSLKTIRIYANDNNIYDNMIPATSVMDPSSVKEIVITGAYQEVFQGDIINLKATGLGINPSDIEWSVTGAGASLQNLEDYSVNLILTSAAEESTITITAYDSTNRINKATVTIKTKSPVTEKIIDFTAFDRCNSLEALYIYAINPNSIILSNGTQFSLSKNVKIYVPAGSKARYAASSAWSQFADQIIEME